METKLSWSWFGFFLGPFYFFMCGAYIPAIIILFVRHTFSAGDYLLITSLSNLASIFISIFCALTAEHFTDKPLNRKHQKLRQKLIDKGYTEQDLRNELRRRERGGGIKTVITAISALFLYWGADYFVEFIIVSLMR